MRRRLADTSFLAALVDSRDDDHSLALELFRERQVLVISELVLVEFLNYFSGQGLRLSAVRRAYEWREGGGVLFIHQSPARLTRAMELYAGRQDKDWSLTDCLSFLIMQQLNISEALSADHHFVQAGFRALLI